MDFNSLSDMSGTGCNFQNEGIAIEPFTTKLHISVYRNFCKQTIQKNPKSVCSLCYFTVYFNASTKYIFNPISEIISTVTGKWLGTVGDVSAEKNENNRYDLVIFFPTHHYIITPILLF